MVGNFHARPLSEEGSFSSNEWALQNTQYAFPYHYTPHFSEGGPSIVRILGWGLEYLCYVCHAVELVREIGPQSVLDVGCGDGRLLSELSFVPRRVGVDLSEDAIGFARAFAPDVDFRTTDVHQVTEAFDLVSSIEVLEHVPDDAVPNFVSSLAARVRPGGYLLISVPTTLRPRHPKHFRHYDRQLLMSTLEDSVSGWETIREDHLVADSATIRLYQKLTVNRFWVFESSILSRLVWRHLWNKRQVAPGKGAHLIMLFRRPL